MLISVIVPNHGRDISTLKNSLPEDVEFLEVNLGLERSEQRNIGISNASGEGLLILDSDQSIQDGLITECICCLKAGYDCLYIPEVIVAKSLFGKIRAFERTFYTGTAVDVPRLVRAKYCPFFDKRLNGPEDADWANILRKTMVPREKIDTSPGSVNYVSRPLKFATTTNVLYHHDDIGILEYIRKKIYYSKSMKMYSKKWPNDPCLNLKYRCWTVFTEKRKWKRLIKHPLLTLGIVFVLAIRGIIYARQ